MLQKISKAQKSQEVNILSSIGPSTTSLCICTLFQGSLPSYVVFLPFAESQEEEVKLSVANCLSLLVASPIDKHQKATDLAAACLKTAKISRHEETWLFKSHGPAPINPRAKLELSQADLQRFIDCLLRPDKVPGAVKVSQEHPDIITADETYSFHG